MKVIYSGNIFFFYIDEINDDMSLYKLWVEICIIENKYDC